MQDKHGKHQDRDDTEHPKKKGNFFTTTKDGSEICYRWASGTEGSCEDVCSAGRVHVCQFCLQPHRNEACSQRPKGKLGKGKEGKGNVL
jgi:hypothetical protein